MLLRNMHGKLQPLIPYNLVHELYNTDPRVTDAALAGDDALSFEELKLLQIWYARIVRMPDKGHK